MFEAINSFWDDAKKVDKKLGLGAVKAPAAVAVAFAADTVINTVKKVFGFDSASYVENPKLTFQREYKASLIDDEKGFSPDSKFGKMTADEFMAYQKKVLAMSQLFDGKASMRKADLLVAAMAHPDIVTEIQSYMTDIQDDAADAVADTVNEVVSVESVNDDVVDVILDDSVSDATEDSDGVLLVADIDASVPRQGIDISDIIDSLTNDVTYVSGDVVDDLSETDIEPEYVDALYTSLEDNEGDDIDVVVDDEVIEDDAVIEDDKPTKFTLDLDLDDPDDSPVTDELPLDRHVSVFADEVEDDDFELSDQPMSTYSDKRYAGGMLAATDLAQIDSSGAVIAANHSFDYIFVDVFKRYINYFVRDNLHFKVESGSLYDAHNGQVYIAYDADTDSYTVTDDFYKYLLSFVSWHYLCSGMFDRGVKMALS